MTDKVEDVDRELAKLRYKVTIARARADETGLPEHRSRLDVLVDEMDDLLDRRCAAMRAVPA